MTTSFLWVPLGNSEVLERGNFKVVNLLGSLPGNIVLRLLAISGNSEKT